MSNRTNLHRNPYPERTATIRWLSVMLAAAGAWMSIGCDGAQKLAFREKFKHYTPQQNYDILLHDTDADARRRAAVRIGDGPFALEDAFAVLDTTARTDANGQVRCAAIRVLAKYQDGRPVPTMLAILNPQAHPDEATPASEPVRWDATLALAGFCEAQFVPGQHADEVREVLISLLLNDNDRNVRMA
ncbi:MAG: HEAT repeat domain-containing protein, partial [Phycisphaerae bacterium]|nr:HEAT repeat domain-containing protein [Phycisphaerae bacterium]